MYKIIKKVAVSLLLLLVALCSFGLAFQVFSESTAFTSALSYFFNRHNFHEVRTGELYRSGELSENELKSVLEDYHIKYVVDLRQSGDKVKKNGFSERAISTDLGANYIWIPMVGSNTKQKRQIQEVLALISKSDGPTLVHCSSGTHRSGLVSAIWLMDKDGIDPHIAAEQLSTKYGYFQWERDFKSYTLGHKTADYVLWHYIEEYNKSGIGFRDWLNKKSDPL